MLFTGAAVSFLMLLVVRRFLGIVTATSGPTVESLTGDLYPQSQRGRILGLIESGELVGTGLGYVLAGALLALFSWRDSFWVFVIPGLFLAFSFWRLPEPPRGGRQEDVGPTRLHAAIHPETGPGVRSANAAGPDDDSEERDLAVIVTTSIGYFFSAGLQTFAIILVLHQYHVSHGEAIVFIPVVGAGAVTGGGHRRPHR